MGSFRTMRSRRFFEDQLDPEDRRELRCRRIVQSIRGDLENGARAYVRKIANTDHYDLYRIELERPDVSYVRTTILDHEAMAVLLEQTTEKSLHEQFVFRD